MHKSKQRGSVTVLVAVLLPVLIGISAFAVDLGYRYLAQAELQNAADSAALAGASTLYRNGTLNWNEAISSAETAVNLNSVAGHKLSRGTVIKGYWNPSNSTPTLITSPTSLSQGDSPAISVTISKSSGINNGELTTFFAKYWGINSMPIRANAIAGRTSPNTIPPGYLFPVVITQCLYTKYWNATSVPPSPKIDPSTNRAYLFRLSSSQNYSGCNGGDWSSLDQNSNGTSTIRSLINNLNPNPLSIGDKVWVKPGVATSLFNDVNSCSAAGNKKCEYVLAPVVENNYTSNGTNSILAFACLRITQALGGSSKYIEVQMSNQCSPASASGVGLGYGVLSSPRLFQ